MDHILFGHTEVLRYLAENKLKDNPTEVEALEAAIAIMNLRSYTCGYCRENGAPKKVMRVIVDGCKEPHYANYCPDCGRFIDPRGD